MAIVCATLRRTDGAVQWIQVLRRIVRTEQNDSSVNFLQQSPKRFPCRVKMFSTMFL